MKNWLIVRVIFTLLFIGFWVLEIAAQSTDSSRAAYTLQIPGSLISFKMVPISGGSFTMGSVETEKGRRADEGPQHTVTIAAFWMEEHEVTYDEFLLFFNDEQVSRNSQVDAVTRPTPQYIDLSWGMGKQGGFPVNSMSQHTAMMYCRWLYLKTGQFYRLPTEAEWEYACRAGSTTTYFFGNDEAQLKDYAWFALNSKNKYQKVMQKKPNAWGLYDMLGNVAEWTLDGYNESFYASDNAKKENALAIPTTQYPRVVRGGGYLDPADALRSAARTKSEARWNRRDPQIPKSKWWLTDGMSVGFRVVRPAGNFTKEEIEKFYNDFLGTKEEEQ